jgi:hypothetical protein
LLVAGADARATTLTSFNNTLDVNSDTGAGVTNWTINNQQQLFREWFFFRVGTATNGPFNSTTLQGTPVISGGDYTATYAVANSWTVNMHLTLVGSPTNFFTGDLAETVTVTNNGTAALPFTIFEYTDWDLAGTIANDTVTLLPTTSNAALVTVVDDGFTATTSVLTSLPISRYELANFNTTLVKLTTTNSDLSNVYSTGTVPPFTGPDTTWALQWSLNLAPNQTFTISKDKLVTFIPEPASLVMMGTGVLAIGGLGVVRRRRQG